ncbi:hypothetical protein CV_1042 [Chromobacterium violaceum ATCC 12472]|uniref:Uncharacterized protein n=1 Tax=Chromobacterium violaceum (strain ATCC 12472 / DSM 30191 / JCM 1249 / CCUG 213 / NBRC 12614 / NCIMB 9131 / NCTC 9757 / MK) TaxID=243365 RepID=Q7NZ80_CHRVO|nr:hypothetical protein CV_1042 [Chromobacterium violaceum ATCC 12472]
MRLAAADVAPYPRGIPPIDGEESGVDRVAASGRRRCGVVGSRCLRFRRRPRRSGARLQTAAEGMPMAFQIRPV